MRSSLCFLAALLLSSPSHIEGFVPPRSTPQLQHATSSRHEHADNNSGRQSSETIFYNDFDEPQISEDLDVSSLLQKRAKELRRAERQLLKNWRSGKTKSYGAITINERYLIDKDQDPDLPFDWVRRVDIGKWPRIACGSAHGSIFVADVDVGTNKILGEARGVHYSQHNNDHTNCLDEQLQRFIYGEFDGGGVLDIAMFGNSLVASAGREGGVKLFKLIENQRELVFQGEITALVRRMPGALPVIVTSMKFDSLGRLFLGCSDGYLRIVTFPDKYTTSTYIDLDVDVELVHPTSEQQPCSILALDISETLNMVVTAHSNGDACVYSIKERVDGTLEGSAAGVWNPFSTFISTKSYARSVVFASMEWRGKMTHAVVLGGGNGEIWICEIDPTSSALFADGDAQKFQPDHSSPVVCLASRPGGIVVSIGQDGLARVTHAWIGAKTAQRKELTPLYGIGGLKVWVGSICVDDEGKRLVSDGFDDAVVVHDFSLGNDESNESDEL